LGGDVHIGPGVLSLDAIGGYVKDAVSLSLAGAAQIQSPLTATLSDNTNVMALARYTFDKLKLYAGYEWIQFAPPSDAITVGGFNDLSGDFICAGCANVNGTNINNLAFSASNGFKDRIMQVVWTGARYSVTDSLDVAVAYYHYDQNSFVASPANILSCAKSATSLSSCAGTMDTVSALIDWKFAPKWDTYIGTMFSQMNGGLDSGFLSRSNLATTAGVRFRW
jgi:predicted porin